jgi:hypothetical protein
MWIAFKDILMNAMEKHVLDQNKMSWSLIPGRGLHLFTSDLWVVKTRSRVLSSRVGKSTICSIHKSCTISMKDFFMWFGYVEPSIVILFQLISGKLMSPAIHKLLCLINKYGWTTYRGTNKIERFHGSIFPHNWQHVDCL